MGVTFTAVRGEGNPRVFERTSICFGWLISTAPSWFGKSFKSIHYDISNNEHFTPKHLKTLKELYRLFGLDEYVKISLNRGTYYEKEVKVSTIKPMLNFKILVLARFFSEFTSNVYGTMYWLHEDEGIDLRLAFFLSHLIDKDRYDGHLTSRALGEHGFFAESSRVSRSSLIFLANNLDYVLLRSPNWKSIEDGRYTHKGVESFLFKNHPIDDYRCTFRQELHLNNLLIKEDWRLVIDKAKFLKYIHKINEEVTGG